MILYDLKRRSKREKEKNTHKRLNEETKSKETYERQEIRRKKRNI